MSDINIEFPLWENIDGLDKRFVASMPDDLVLDACSKVSHWVATVWRSIEHPEWRTPMATEGGLKDGEEAMKRAISLWKVLHNHDIS